MDRLEKRAHEIFRDIKEMHKDGKDISKRAPLELLMKKKYNLSALDTAYCLKLMERKYPDELISMHYRSFSRWNSLPKYQTLPVFKNRFSR